MFTLFVRMIDQERAVFVPYVYPKPREGWNKWRREGRRNMLRLRRRMTIQEQQVNHAATYNWDQNRIVFRMLCDWGIPEVDTFWSALHCVQPWISMFSIDTCLTMMRYYCSAGCTKLVRTVLHKMMESWNEDVRKATIVGTMSWNSIFAYQSSGSDMLQYHDLCTME